MSFEPAVVSAITAIVAVIVGPLVSIFVAKNQINASVVSTNRQTWINRLRDELATLVGIVHHLPSAHANKSVSTEALIIVWSKTQRKRKDSCDLGSQISVLRRDALLPPARWTKR